MKPEAGARFAGGAWPEEPGGRRTDRRVVISRGARRGLGTASALALLAMALMAPAARGELAVESGVSWGFNSNVFEAVHRDRWTGDGFARVEVGLQRRQPGRRGWDWHGRARAAAEQYANYRSEDRSLLLGSLGLRWQGSRAEGTWAWTGQRIDRPHADSWDLRRHQLAHSGAASLSAATRVGWRVDGSWVDTEPDGPSQRHNWRVGGDLERTLTGRLRAVILGEGGEAYYDEPAIESWDNGDNVPAGEDQRDRSLLLGAGLDWSAATLVHLAYGHRAIDSNSLGYSQDRQEVSFSVARLLPLRVSLQVLGQWQEPRYRDRGFAKWRLRADPEDLDVGARSGLTLRLRRPLGAEFCADVQTGWERNESRVSGRFYERFQVLLAIRYQAVP